MSFSSFLDDFKPNCAFFYSSNFNFLNIFEFLIFFRFPKFSIILQLLSNDPFRNFSGRRKSVAKRAFVAKRVVAKRVVGQYGNWAQENFLIALTFLKPLRPLAEKF